MNIKNLLQKEVLDVNANKVGKVIDMDFDLQGGVLNHILVQTGIFKQCKINVNQIDKIGDRLVLGITKDDIEQNK